jgi:hypothetical protein
MDVRASNRHKRETANASYEAYSYCNRTLRAWLATYSVGVPAFLFTKSAVINKLKGQNVLYSVALLFAVAIALQIALTFVNKYTQWAVYAKHTPPPSTGPIIDWCETVSEWIWVDLLLDSATILLLAWGSFDVFTALVAA